LRPKPDIPTSLNKRRQFGSPLGAVNIGFWVSVVGENLRIRIDDMITAAVR
jgi:hypothetical protein